ncbi:hypothetical protein D918_04904 [Trichuris suis]|nr:hypothetical protein D918_04904 [Trichuris suis]
MPIPRTCKEDVVNLLEKFECTNAQLGIMPFDSLHSSSAP